MDISSVHPVTNIVIPAFLISAGIVFFTAIQAAVVGIVGHRKPLYLTFSFSCLCAAGFQLGTVGYYKAGSVAAAAYALHWQAASFAAFCPAFFAFIAVYTDQRRIKPWLFMVITVFVLLLVVSLIQPYSARFSTLETAGVLRLPWGEQLARFRGTPSVWNGLARLSILAILIWAAARAAIQYRGGERRAALFLAAYLVIAAAAMIEGGLVDLGVIDFFYTWGFSYLALAVLMSLSLGLELRDRTTALETSTTELHSTVEMLGRSEERLRRALDAGRVGTWEWNILTNEVSWSDGVEKMFGLETGSFQGTFDAYRALIHPDDLPVLDDSVKRAFEQNIPYAIEHRITWPDGEIHWLLGQGRVFRDSDGRPVSIRGTVLDITERKRAEEALRESEERFRRLSEGPFEGIGITDQGRILDANEQLEKMLGYTQAELTRMNVSELVAPESRELVRGKIQSGDENPYEHMALRKDGSKFPVEVFGKTIPFKGRRVRVTAIRDITERKRNEEALRRALEEVEGLKNQIEAEKTYLQDEIKIEHNFEEIIGGSPNFVKILHQVEQVASTDSTVLILGETGTGKELIARAVHNISPRHDRALVKVNCASLPETLIESELFGHEKGAFTGALSRNVGRFELADGGTIFLDEIGDLPLGLQVKLLRVLQEGEFERLGSSKTHKVNVRVIAATNRDLATAIDKGTFRKDLYFRLNVFPIKIPPLRERKEDIPLIVKHFVSKYAARAGKKIEKISKSSMDILTRYDWPGNIRELENIIERAIIISPGPTLDIGEQLELRPTDPNPQANVRTLKENERIMIRKALEESHWVIEGKQGAAARLDIAPSTLRDRMQKYDIEKPQEPS